MKIWSIYYYSAAIFPLGHQFRTRTTAVLVILSIISLTPSIATLFATPCSIATAEVSLNFGVLGEKSS